MTRFGRVDDNRLAMEDAAQVLGIYPAQKYSVAAEDEANAPMIAARNLYLQFLYA